MNYITVHKCCRIRQVIVAGNSHLVLLVSEGKLSVMHSLRLSGEILCQIFLVHPKCTLGGSTKYHTFRGGGGPYFTFWCWVQICGQKFFPLPSALDLEFSQGGGGGSILYFLMLSPNLWSKIFPFTKCSGLRIFSGWGGVHTLLFDAESKSVVKNFSLYQALWT